MSGAREQSVQAERSKRTNEWTSEWPSTAVWINDYSGPQCRVEMGIGDVGSLPTFSLRDVDSSSCIARVIAHCFIVYSTPWPLSCSSKAG